MQELYLFLGVLALVCFAAAAIVRNVRDYNLLAAGLFFTTLIVVIQMGQRVF